MKKHLGNTCEHLEFRLSEAKKVLASDELVSNLKMDGVNTLPETNRHSSWKFVTPGDPEIPIGNPLFLGANC